MTTKDYYIKAVKTLIEQDGSSKAVDGVLKDLQKVLAERGHQKLYVPILRSVARELPKESKERAILTVVSDDKSEVKAQTAAAEAQGLSVSDPVVTVDPTIIGGFKLKAGDRVTDGTYKSKLVELYRTIAK